MCQCVSELMSSEIVTAITVRLFYYFRAARFVIRNHFFHLLRLAPSNDTGVWTVDRTGSGLRCPAWPSLSPSPQSYESPVGTGLVPFSSCAELKRLQTGAAHQQLGPVVSAHWRWHHLTSVHVTHLLLFGFVQGRWHMLHLRGTRTGRQGRTGPRAFPAAAGAKFSHEAALCQDRVRAGWGRWGRWGRWGSSGSSTPFHTLTGEKAPFHCVNHWLHREHSPCLTRWFRWVIIRQLD